MPLFPARRLNERSRVGPTETAAYASVSRRRCRSQVKEASWACSRGEKKAGANAFDSRLSHAAQVPKYSIDTGGPYLPANLLGQGVAAALVGRFERLETIVAHSRLEGRNDWLSLLLVPTTRCCHAIH